MYYWLWTAVPQFAASIQTSNPYSQTSQAILAWNHAQRSTPQRSNALKESSSVASASSALIDSSKVEAHTKECTWVATPDASGKRIYRQPNQKLVDNKVVWVLCDFATDWALNMTTLGYSYLDSKFSSPPPSYSNHRLSSASLTKPSDDTSSMAGQQDNSELWSASRCYLWFSMTSFFRNQDWTE